MTVVKAMVTASVPMFARKWRNAKRTSRAVKRKRVPETGITSGPLQAGEGSNNMDNGASPNKRARALSNSAAIPSVTGGGAAVAAPVAAVPSVSPAAPEPVIAPVKNSPSPMQVDSPVRNIKVDEVGTLVT